MDLKKLMKQAEDMQKKMNEMQEKLKDIIVETSVGGGMVTIKMNGKYDVLELNINDEIIKAEEKDILKDLLISAFNESKRKIEAVTSEEMSKITGGMNIPGF